MNIKMMKIPGWLAVSGAMLLLLCAPAAHAAISGIPGPTFNLTAGSTHISTPDGNSIFVWGYDAGLAGGGIGPQYPGPTLIVTQGVPVTVNLSNTLDEPVSIVFPGQTVTTTGGIPGLVTREAQPGGTVSYTFTPGQPGTYLYHSGSHQDLQVEMGLFGAIIVRPTSFNSTAPTAYGDAGSAYDREFLFLLSEMDPTIHELVDFGLKSKVDTTAIHLVNWFINGRGAPDTMAPAGAGAFYLPSQPYNCMPAARPGETVLLRMIGGNKDLHPFHTHGNNFRLIAKDGRVMNSTGNINGAPDLAVSNFTQRVVPGETYDALFTWTGAGLGWDFTGGLDLTGTCGSTDPANCAPFPVALPDNQELTFGTFWSGSPFLGVKAFLPPGQGKDNLTGAYFFMWHSHNERELTNNDIFPGGLLTMFMVDPMLPLGDTP